MQAKDGQCATEHLTPERCSALLAKFAQPGLVGPWLLRLDAVWLILTILELCDDCSPCSGLGSICPALLDPAHKQQSLHCE